MLKIEWIRPMDYLEIMPSKRLKNYINCFWEIKSDQKTKTFEWDRTIPDGSLELVFHLKDDMIRRSIEGNEEKESKNIIIGQVTKPYLFAATGDVHMIGVRFYPHTAHLFFDLSVEEVNDLSLDLELIWNQQCKYLHQQLKETVSTHQKIKLLESFFINRVQNINLSSKDRYFSHACEMILNNNGHLKTDDISVDLGISNRYLQKLFIPRMGISPKFFARIIRFQSVFKLIDSQPSASLTKISHEAGYYDQSHFIREFKEFTGLTPQNYFDENHPVTDHFIEPENSSYLYNYQ